MMLPHLCVSRADATDDVGEPGYSLTERPTAALRSQGTSRDGILAWISAASSRIDGVARMLGPLGGANGLRTTSGSSYLAGALAWPHARMAASWLQHLTFTGSLNAVVLADRYQDFGTKAP